MSSLEFPYEILFWIDPKMFTNPTIVIDRNGGVLLTGRFPPRNITVLVLQEDGESVEITEAQYAKMQRLIDYGMYLNPCVEIYFTQCSTLWGKSGRNFDGMDFDDVMRGPA